MALFAVNRFMGDEDERRDYKSDMDDSVVKQRLAALCELAETRKRKRSIQTEVKPRHKEDAVPVHVENHMDRHVENHVAGKKKKKRVEGKLQETTKTQMDTTKNEEFPILGKESSKRRVKKMPQSLPDWIVHPYKISSDLSNNLLSVQSIGLSDNLVKVLKHHNIMSLFPVQSSVIPAILASCSGPLLSTTSGYQPRDICVSAPTGSGKTLAYVLPLIQCLERTVVRRLRALVILPTWDLAFQVSRVFHMFSHVTKVRVGIATGQQNFAKEQKTLVKDSESLVDILVTTPGRLVDHVTSTQGFILEHVRFLVIDEADRLLDDSFQDQDWLHKVLSGCGTASDILPFHHHTFDSRLSTPLSAISKEFHAVHKPFQKLLFSATLSQDPEKIASLNLFQPMLFTTASSRNRLEQSQNSHEITETESQYSTPETLKEHYIVCKGEEKPLVLLYLVIKLGLSRVLCFTGSIQSTHRLFLLFKFFGSATVAEFSSSLTRSQRQSVVSQFRQGAIDILICSDAMARGMDIENVDHVVCYDAPRYMKTYVHRVGRTARAGRDGNAYVIVREEEAYHFRRMMKLGGKGLKKMKIRQCELDELVGRYEVALSLLESTVKSEK
jgi:ATP-dependent RNA helicase DDX51/DBP6